jgi:glycosyltransferase involved in cell wall biosynthesis
VTRILLLCEGDAETHDSWSGVSKSLVQHLRALGHTVRTGDVDLHGIGRSMAAVRTIALSRKRWWVRYHLSEAGFVARSTESAHRINELLGDADVIVQIGATFSVPAYVRVPVILFCDSNIALSKRAASSGVSEAAFLSDAEIAEIHAREAKVYERAALIFTMSDLARRSFIEDFGVPAAKLVTLHCGPNIPVPDPPPLELPEGPPTILFVGRDFNRKGGGLLLQAFRQVRTALPEARVRLIGSVQDGVRDRGVEFVPFQSRDTASGRDAMERAYRSATVFCLPTRFEPFGTSFVEAMFYALPCVGPKAWAVPEIIEHGVTGYTVPPDDAGALADALLTVLRDPERARAMGIVGRDRAFERFTWPGITTRMDAALTGLLAGTRDA